MVLSVLSASIYLCCFPHEAIFFLPSVIWPQIRTDSTWNTTEFEVDLTILCFSKVVKVFVSTRSHNSSEMSAQLAFIRLRSISSDKRLKHSTHTNLLQRKHTQWTEEQGTHLRLSSARECNLWIDLQRRIQKKRSLLSDVSWYTWTSHLLLTPSSFIPSTNYTLTPFIYDKEICFADCSPLYMGFD